jgi:hypothetical protein
MIGDRVFSPEGPGQLVAIASPAAGRAWIWDGSLYEYGPYIVRLHGSDRVTGFTYDQLETDDSGY